MRIFFVRPENLARIARKDRTSEARRTCSKSRFERKMCSILDFWFLIEENAEVLYNFTVTFYVALILILQGK